jgi:hypothetical protein
LINQTLGLYQTLINLGFKIIFLTGRTWDEHDATVQNMQNAGYKGKQFDHHSRS